MSSGELVFPSQIESVFIFSESGLPLFIRTTSLERKVDDLMISGFLSAVFSFSEQVVEQGGSIKSMEVGSSIFIFEKAGSCIFAVQGPQQSNLGYLETIVRRMTDEWDKLYGLQGEFLDGVQDTYHSYETILQQIFHSTGDVTSATPEIQILEKPISVPFLLNTIKKGMDKVLTALIGGDLPVLVTGDKARVELAVATLERFAPYDLQSITWGDHLDSVDLLGLPPEAIEYPLPQNIVVLDLTEAKVIGGQSTKYARNLIKALEKLQTGGTLALVDKMIGELATTTKQLVELAQDDQLTIQNFASLLKNVDSSAVELLFKICNRLDPAVYPKLMELHEQQTTATEARVKSYLEDF